MNPSLVLNVPDHSDVCLCNTHVNGLFLVSCFSSPCFLSFLVIYVWYDICLYVFLHEWSGTLFLDSRLSVLSPFIVDLTDLWMLFSRCPRSARGAPVCDGTCRRQRNPGMRRVPSPERPALCGGVVQVWNAHPLFHQLSLLPSSCGPGICW